MTLICQSYAIYFTIYGIIVVQVISNLQEWGEYHIPPRVTYRYVQSVKGVSLFWKRQIDIVFRQRDTLIRGWINVSIDTCLKICVKVSQPSKRLEAVMWPHNVCYLPRSRKSKTFKSLLMLPVQEVRLNLFRFLGDFYSSCFFAHN